MEDTRLGLHVILRGELVSGGQEVRSRDLGQCGFLRLLDGCIAFLRRVGCWHLTRDDAALAGGEEARRCPIHRVPAGQADRSQIDEGFPAAMRTPGEDVFLSSCDLGEEGEARLCWRGRDVPQILYDVTQALSPFRRRPDIAHWYYEDVRRQYGITLGAGVQTAVRAFVAALRWVRDPSTPPAYSRRLPAPLCDPGELRAALRRHDAPAGRTPTTPRAALADSFTAAWLLAGRQGEPARGPDQAPDGAIDAGLLEVTHALGMVTWPREETPGTEGLVPLRAAAETPDASVLMAKLFGLKTDIPGFDDLFGGGLIPHSPATAGDHRPCDDAPRHGILGVIRGRFGTGKSTLAAQLAFEMARKGGAGILLVLEQTVEEVLAQARHFGWLPHDEPFRLVRDDEPDPAREPDRGDETRGDRRFREALAEAKEERRGVLFVRSLRGSSLSHLQRWLYDVRRIPGFDEEFPLRFVVVDPLDAVQLSPKETEATDRAQLVRNRTQEILKDATSRGITLWLTTGDVDPDKYHTPYNFLPNLGDVVLRLTLVAAGAQPRAESINASPLRLLEIEKVRTQRFAKGAHPAEITSASGMHVYPSGSAPTEFVTWVNSRAARCGQGRRISLGHAALDLAIGTDGVLPGDVTTLMGPTGCAKTELALQYLLCQADDFEPDERALFISFRDDEGSIDQILRGGVGTQLGIPTWSQATDKLDLLRLEVGNTSSGELLQRIREQFRRRSPAVRYTRVAVDNVAYMDLTSPLVRQDELFVPNLLAIFRLEGVTPLFNTSLVEGVISESRLQTQIRDASDNLIKLLRNHYRSHSFIALQIKKAKQLKHMEQPLEIRVEHRSHPLDVDALRAGLRCLLKDAVSVFPPTNTEPCPPASVKDEIEAAQSDGPAPSGSKRPPQAAAAPDRGIPAFLHGEPELDVWLRKAEAAARSREERAAQLREERGVGEAPSGGVSAPDHEYDRWRAQLARRVHEIYAAICEAGGTDPLVTRWEDEDERRGGRESTRVTGTEERQRLASWRSTYRDVMQRLELQQGISVRFHALDDYEEPMGERKLERIGVARAAREH